MKLGLIGLGKMGSRIGMKLLQDGHELMVWNRSKEPIRNLEFKIHNSEFNLKFKNLKVAGTIEKLVKSLGKPRIIWLMLTAGEATQDILNEVSKFVEKGDIVIDGGNSNYIDTEKRYQDFKKKEISFLGIGVSGGIIAATNGYPLMVGGSKSAFNYLKPIFESLSKPAHHASKARQAGGYEYFGEGGAGHFVKMVHNGMEYGIMQSIGEGFEVLEKSPYHFDLLKIAKLYQKGTLVSGFMLDRAANALSKDKHLDKIEGVIAESGEAKWTVEEAKKEGVKVEIIERSLEYRRRSQKDKKIQKSFTAKMIAALRHEFGGHEVKKVTSS